MKRTRKAPWFAAGMLCAAMLASTVGPALAAVMVPQTLEVHTGVEVYVDDKRIDAGETHGNPDAFIYNGTTYVAVAAVSKSLGENVIWDGENKHVYIGEHEGASYNLLSVCPPYQTSNYYNDFPTVTMSGKKYANAMITAYSYGELFNLNGQYDKLSFIVGHRDGEQMRYGDQFNIYLDGELAYSIDLDPEAMPEKHTIDLDGAVQMKIEGTGRSNTFALAELKIS